MSEVPLYTIRPTHYRRAPQPNLILEPHTLHPRPHTLNPALKTMNPTP